ncbi:hypothetical protein G0Q06_10080 [Puniceicoccales bacterium CK1056]|uniref:Uncharacterized protein n=1 Tax=Oceanipulchritudo coccoides TaxID=2706888 RepID=A0A6B2M1J4_9BACT|nr:hypothetical protein [Oceanipulchritudo coccoides]NDV62798.1 hypothetical protein [Oceanipulchritudo coccoides]
MKKNCTPSSRAIAKWLIPMALSLCCFHNATHGWGVTEVLEGETDWVSADWSHGLPSSEDTVYIQNVAKVSMKEKAKREVHGVRLSRTPDGGGMPTLQIEQSYLNAKFIVVGDAANASGTFIQAGGMLKIDNTKELGFEIGNPANNPTGECYLLATFAAGQSAIGKLRFNLRNERKSRLTIFGTLPKVIADSITFEAGKADQWQPAEINYILTEAGVVPIYVRGEANLGDGDRVKIIIDGGRYEGEAKTFPLIIADKIVGKPAEIKIEGLGSRAEIKQDGKQLKLVIK